MPPSQFENLKMCAHAQKQHNGVGCNHWQRGRETRSEVGAGGQNECMKSCCAANCKGRSASEAPSSLAKTTPECGPLFRTAPRGISVPGIKSGRQRTNQHHVAPCTWRHNTAIKAKKSILVAKHSMRAGIKPRDLPCHLMPALSRVFETRATNCVFLERRGQGCRSVPSHSRTCKSIARTYCSTCTRIL